MVIKIFSTYEISCISNYSGMDTWSWSIHLALDTKMVLIVTMTIASLATTQKATIKPWPFGRCVTNESAMNLTPVLSMKLKIWHENFVSTLLCIFLNFPLWSHVQQWKVQCGFLFCWLLKKVLYFHPPLGATFSLTCAQVTFCM